MLYNVFRILYAGMKLAHDVKTGAWIAHCQLVNRFIQANGFEVEGWVRYKGTTDCMRVCWNRQTGTFEGRVSIDVRVQVPSLAPQP